MAAAEQQGGRSRQADPHRATGPTALADLNQWWQEARILVRKLLDDGDLRTAYRIARDAAPPPRGYFRADQYFTAGWIALRFLDDPKTAATHFAHIVEDTVSPYALARGGYWQGRGRGHGPARAGQGLLRNGGAIYRDLLRSDCAGTAGAHRSGLARAALVHAGQARRDA